MQTVALERLLENYSKEYFRELATFGALSDETIRWLLTEGCILKLDKGDTLYQAGNQVQAFYVILCGQLSLFMPHGDELVLTCHYGVGEQIGFSAMIALHKRYNTAIADRDSFVLEIPVDRFHELHIRSAQEFGVLLLNLSREMARTIASMGDQIEQLSDSSGHPVSKD